MGVGRKAPLARGDTRLFCEEELLEGVVLHVEGGEVAVFSARSPARETPNEDSAAVIGAAEETAVVAVADGFGGAPSGRLASRIAVESLAEALWHARDEGQDTRWGILNGFERANERVLALGVGAATTLTVAEVGRRSVRAYHAGDSFVLVTGGRGKSKLQTIPHSPVGYGVESGLLDEKEAMRHEERHLVSNAIGSADLRIDVGIPVELAPRDTLVIASDGLSDNLHTDEIVEMVRRGPLRAAARRLAERARARMSEAASDAPSKPDDLTFLVFRPRKTCP